jgi:glutathione S-transferase
MLTLYHAPRSRSSRILWLLEELGEPYDVAYVDIRRGDGSGQGDASNPHPHGKVPALVHDGALVTESAAICLYLSDAFPKAGLGPAVGEPGRAAYLSWLAYYAGVVEPSLTCVYMKVEPPPGVPGWAPWSEVEGRIAALLEKGPWALGERFSTLDILIGSLLQWAAPMFPERPAYEAFKARIMQRPALQRALAKDEPAA